MSRRDHADARCRDCMMYARLCICSLIPSLATRHRLVLLVHYREARKPTNTGQLAARCLVGSRVEIVGDRARPLRAPLVEPNEQAVVLYPSEDAVPILELAASGAPLTVIVPDGNWRQAAKMGRRVPGLDRIPRVTLGDSPPTEYRLRAEPHIDGLATIEAIARAWRTLERDAGAAIEAAMLHVFRVMVSRTLWLRGALPAAQVIDGLPSNGSPGSRAPAK
jgi:DTW domain-containing protein YfiP